MSLPPDSAPRAGSRCRWLFLLGVTLAVPGGNASAQTAPAEVRDAAHNSTFNPWGHLRTSSLRLMAPESTFAELAYSDYHRWVFEYLSWPEVQPLLVAAALEPELVALLHDPSIRSVHEATGGTILRVPDFVRWSLKPKSREIIYRELASGMENLTHILPLILPDSAALERLNFSPGLRAAVRQLTFSRGNHRCLVDADLLAAHADSPDEMRRLFRQIYTYQVLVVELSRDEISDSPRIADYWTQHRAKLRGSLNQLFARSPDLDAIDISHFLPKFPQVLLNTFPDGQTSPFNANCHWLALNFFRRIPDSKFLPSQKDHDNSGHEAVMELHAYYDQVEPPFQFGDVIALVAESGDAFELVHTAVHIADNIVFSKNGIGRNSPFALITLEEMMAKYAWATELTVRGFRPQPGTPALPN